jgi:hypothetical protein
MRGSASSARGQITFFSSTGSPALLAGSLELAHARLAGGSLSVGHGPVEPVALAGVPATVVPVASASKSGSDSPDDADAGLRSGRPPGVRPARAVRFPFRAKHQSCEMQRFTPDCRFQSRGACRPRRRASTDAAMKMLACVAAAPGCSPIHKRARRSCPVFDDT